MESVCKEVCERLILKPELCIMSTRKLNPNDFRLSHYTFTVHQKLEAQKNTPATTTTVNTALLRSAVQRGGTKHADLSAAWAPAFTLGSDGQCRAWHCVGDLWLHGWRSERGGGGGVWGVCARQARQSDVVWTVARKKEAEVRVVIVCMRVRVCILGLG